MKTVAIIGGGASGMMAALTAAEDRDNRVIIFERQQRVGRKLLSTGNGRCNITNDASDVYVSDRQRRFAEGIIERFPARASMEYFETLGLKTVSEYGGRVYPYSNSANSVLDVLRFALDGAGVEIKTACPVKRIERRKRGFDIIADEERLFADSVIVACGGMAGGKVGGVKDGYELLKSLGHTCTKLYPSLVQLVTDAEVPRALKGVRCQAAVAVHDAVGGTLQRAEGELQFTEKGVSGTVIFDVSRAAAMKGIGGDVTIGFGLNMLEYREYIENKMKALPDLEASELFTGLLHNRLGKVIVKLSGVSAAKRIGELTEDEIARLIDACWIKLRIKGTEGFDSAQVTAGGISTDEFDPKTLESRIVPGLYACGEVLDVDFPCGGHNLKWAWASGHTAGRLGR